MMVKLKLVGPQLEELNAKSEIDVIMYIIKPWIDQMVAL